MLELRATLHGLAPGEIGDGIISSYGDFLLVLVDAQLFCNGGESKQRGLKKDSQRS